MFRINFEETILPHTSSAFNLARYLCGNDDDARDIVQESLILSFRNFQSFRGGNPKAWLLKIVRNTFYSWMRKEKGSVSLENLEEPIDPHSGPERETIARLDMERILTALEDMNPLFREALVLREVENLSYREIGEILDIPAGTVMSRIARARDILQNLVASEGI